MGASIRGIHHITAIASGPQPNLDFYTGFLGLRLVKKTVNFDDPGSYHLYYGDQAGAPGTILTFFPWPGARRGKQGTGQVTATAFAVPQNSLDYWDQRANERLVAATRESVRFGEEVLTFADPDGMPLELIAAAVNPGIAIQGTTVESQHAIAGFHAAAIQVKDVKATAGLLTGLMGFELTKRDSNRFRYEVANGGPGAAIDLIETPGAARGLGGAGTVHHIAWRTPDDEQQREWLRQLAAAGYQVSPIMDRQYFHSIYFREPGGVLFEIATDPPGFTLDEPLQELGEKLMLPPWMEPMRARIEQALPPLKHLAGV
ncbi:MAG TPA: ring-cleaving dioxygenase [Bryobacteraceae bacterium]|nr:ring-cleaving dioxygenase [Bryobacteraceae bacterium]